MITVKLYGNLGKEFGKIHNYKIKSPNEAIRALCANFSGFEKHLLDDKYIGYKIYVDNEDRSDIEELSYPADTTIKIVPVLQGAGGNNIGRIVLGAALITAAILLSPYTGGTTLGLIAQIGVTAMTAIGTSLVLSGISGLLYSPSSKPVQSIDSQNQITSTYFNGPINLAAQGNPVPLVYGRMRVGSQVISAGLLTYKE